MALFDKPIAPETYALVRYGMSFPGRGSPMDAAGILARLEQPDTIAARWPVVGFDAVQEAGYKFLQARKAQRKKQPGADEEVAKWKNWSRQAYSDNFIADLVRCVESDNPFRERLHHFWGNHFTARAKSLNLLAGAAGYAETALRPHLSGPFAEMLKAAVTHPFMLVYLDQAGSVGPNSRRGLARGAGLNENMAREVLELHTLGVGAGYTQADVRQFAELLTGMSFNLLKGARFRQDMAEPGAETVLGVEYGGGRARLEDIHTALEDLARHPATAAHLSAKLASHFIADDPDPALVAQMTDVWIGSDGDLAQVYAAMLDHPAAWQGFGAKVKPPFDYMATSLRALGLGAATLRGLDAKTVKIVLLRSLVLMGQDYQKPLAPNGWPDTQHAWVHPQGVAARIDWAMRAPRRLSESLPDPRDFVGAALGDAATASLTWAAGAAESRIEGVGIVLASAEFNRR